jgi:hypothetical protein
MAGVVTFNSFKRDILNGSIDLDTDTIKAMICTSSFAPDIDAMTKRSDITNEVSGTGYSAGGMALANKTVTPDNTNDWSIFDADDLQWTTATITGRFIVLYKSRGGASSADELIGYVDMGGNYTSTAGNWDFGWAAGGILKVTGSAFYNRALEWIGDGTIDLDTDDIYVALVTSSYTFDKDAHDFFNDITNEVVGTGYTAGGQALASKTVGVDNTDDEGVFNSAALSWATSTITARGMVFYKKRGGASSADELIAYVNFGADKVSTGGTFSITPNAEGWFNLNAA